MKNKVRVSIIVVLLFMCINSNCYSFSKVDAETFIINQEDNFELRTDIKNENDKTFSGKINGIYIQERVYSSSSAKKYEYDKEDIEKKIEEIKKGSNNNNTYRYTIYNSDYVELNGIKGIRITHIRDYTSYTRYYDEYYLLTDNYEYQIVFRSTNTNLINTEIENRFINSFRAKDTIKSYNDIPFNDVLKGRWYYNAVKYAYTNKIISGYNDYTFAPSDKVTRGMFVTMLYNMSGKPAIKSKASKFKDVKDSKKWYYKAVLWASENGIVSGYDNGNFGPNDNITREQLVVMLCNYAKYKKKDVSKQGNITTFGDYKKVSGWAEKQVKWAIGAGVITGSNGNINPKGSATRAETASMIYKYCKKVGK